MEYQNRTSGKETECLNSDIINTLPQNIIRKILCLIPIRDALRTSVLAKKWQYCWRTMPELVFTENMVTVSCNHLCTQLKKYKLASAIFHVLLLHNGPERVEFYGLVGELQMDSEFSQMIRYLARESKVNQLLFVNDNRAYKLPVSFFSFQGLEYIHLENCTFEPPLKFNIFHRLRSMTFVDVEVSAQMLQRFLSNCPLLLHITLNEYPKGIASVSVGENKFTFVGLSKCVPLIQVLDISKYYMKYLCAGGMPHKLPASLVHLKDLFLDVCLVEQNEISSALCIIRSSPVLGSIIFEMYDNDKLPVRQTPTNFLNPENYPDLKLDHLETLVIHEFSNLPLEMEFVKLIMAKSPVLEKVEIQLQASVSLDEELRMLKDLVLLPFPRASPSAKLTIVRPKTS